MGQVGPVKLCFYCQRPFQARSKHRLYKFCSTACKASSHKERYGYKAVWKNRGIIYKGQLMTEAIYLEMKQSQDGASASSAVNGRSQVRGVHCASTTTIRPAKSEGYSAPAATGCWVWSRNTVEKSRCT